MSVGTAWIRARARRSRRRNGSRAADPLPIDAEDHSARVKGLTELAVAGESKGVAQQAGGHVFASEGDCCVPPAEATMSTLSGAKTRILRKSQKNEHVRTLRNHDCQASSGHGLRQTDILQKMNWKVSLMNQRFRIASSSTVVTGLLLVISSCCRKSPNEELPSEVTDVPHQFAPAPRLSGRVFTENKMGHVIPVTGATVFVVSADMVSEQAPPERFTAKIRNGRLIPRQVIVCVGQQFTISVEGR